MTDVRVRRANAADVARIAPLFDAYRQFYRQPSDLARARAFLEERAARDESIAFVAERNPRGDALGFAQVYPVFSSVRCARAWILNDLFVGAAYVELSTETNNANARALYQSEGYELENGFEHYTLVLGRSSSTT